MLTELYTVKATNINYNKLIYRQPIPLNQLIMFQPQIFFQNSTQLTINQDQQSTITPLHKTHFSSTSITKIITGFPSTVPLVKDTVQTHGFYILIHTYIYYIERRWDRMILPLGATRSSTEMQTRILSGGLLKYVGSF